MINKRAFWPFRKKNTDLEDEYSNYLLHQIMMSQFAKEYADTYANYTNAGGQADRLDFHNIINEYGTPADKTRYKNSALAQFFPYEDGLFLGGTQLPDAAARQDLLSRVQGYDLKTPEEKRGRELYIKAMKALGDMNFINSSPISGIDDQELGLINDLGEDSFINSSKANSLGYADAYPDDKYQDTLREHGLNYSNRDVVEARALQVRALRDAAAIELQRRKGLK